jgi:asparagine synthase (glutamine-hydrolysing)
MCGIAGFTGQQQGEGTLAAMSSLLVHRGPDEHGEYRSDDVSLAVRRLAIIDVACGHQPYFNEQGDVIAVFNGEIYGFVSLRAELQRAGHKFTSSTDGEVIVHSYEEYGDDFLTRLDGMFALALWDVRRKRLVLARDRLGKKPLYVAVHHDGRAISFASELEALLADPLVERKVDAAAISNYLKFGYVPSPLCAFANVRKVTPGSALVWEAGRIKEFRYWTLHYEPKLRVGPREAATELDRKVGGAVRARLISDVPLGAFLSGGVDSSLVVANMVEAGCGPVRTFSIGFDDPRYDERPHAARVARALRTEHKAELIAAKDVPDVLSLLVRRYGEPYADSSAVPTYYLARMARHHVTVALTGDGGDELLAGYERHVAARWADSFDRLPAALRRAVIRVGQSVVGPDSDETSRRHKAYRLLRSLELPAAERFADWSSNLTEAELARHVSALPRLELPEPDGVARDPLDRALAMDVAHHLPDDLLTKMDIATMACSLEARAPLLDYRLVEWAARLPVRLKQRRLERKRLLRDVLARRLPRELFERPKMGFTAPTGAWLRGELRDLMLDTVVSPDARSRDYLNVAEVERTVREHLGLVADHSRALWTILMLELWHREVVEARPVASSSSLGPPPAVPRGQLIP